MDWTRYNETELVVLCHKAGFPETHRGWGQQRLIRLLTTGESDDDGVGPIDQHRLAMRFFLDRYEHLIRTQLTCDTNCPECPDATAAGCLQLNGHLY